MIVEILLLLIFAAHIPEIKKKNIGDFSSHSIQIQAPKLHVECSHFQHLGNPVTSKNITPGLRILG